MGLFDELRQGAQSAGAVGGIVTGIVRENWDDEHPGKVKVELFLGQSGKNVTGWIPVMTPYAGKNFGMYALPEVGSEVVVAFTMGDRNSPVVLGCLWSSASPVPPETAAKENPVKKFVTKGGNLISVSEEKDKDKIEIKTIKNTGILLDDENQQITVHDDQNKNQVIINAKDGTITVQAEKKIIFKAGDKDALVIDGTGKKVTVDSGSIDVNAQNAINIKGQNVTVDGTALALKGKSSLNAESSGTTIVKGTMVKIN